MKTGPPLHEQVASHSRMLLVWANRLGRRRYANPARCWGTRGSQETLRRIARHLKQMCVQYSSSEILLTRSLAEYLACLDTAIDDAREEAGGRGAPIERWKAGGEARVLPRICAGLARLVDTSLAQYGVLSLDGQTLVASTGLGSSQQRARLCLPVLPPGLTTYQEELLQASAGTGV